ncbi:hypothetical protein ACOMHN_063369 [Nucella lapillus]
MSQFVITDDLSESYKYDMELQTEPDMNHTPSHRPPQDPGSDIELPPSPGANTSCPPYNTDSLQRQPDKAPCDDFSDNFSGMWRQDPTSDGGEMTDVEITSVAAETTTMCSVLTGNEDNTDYPTLPERKSSSCSRLQSPPSPSPRHRSPPISEMQSVPLPLPDLPASSPGGQEFQDYQCYVDPLPRRRSTTPTRQQRDRGTELFLSQYYKSLEQENGSRSSTPPQ